MPTPTWTELDNRRKIHRDLTKLRALKGISQPTNPVQRSKLICRARQNGASLPQLILATGLPETTIRRILFNA